MPNLIISRRQGESIVIDERITIRVLDYHGGQVKISIEAPREVNIRRGELPARAGPAGGAE